MPRISPIYARFVLRAVRWRQLDERPLFRNTCLDADALETGGEISLGDFVAILHNARDLLQEDTLGLEMGRQAHMAAFGLTGAAIIAAPDLREGLQALEDFARLVVSYIRLELRVEPRFLTVRVRLTEDLGEVAERYHVEGAFCQVQAYIETVTGRQLTGARYEFAFPEPGYSHLYPNFLHSPIRYDQAVHAMRLPLHLMDQRSPFYDRQAWQAMRMRLAENLRQMSAVGAHAYSEHVHAFLNSLEPPFPAATVIAERLHISERTLNRRLAEENTSYRVIRHDKLRAWAGSCLTETRDSVEAIAARLGYTDAANFRRAFRQWFGMSPSQYRQSSR